MVRAIPRQRQPVGEWRIRLRRAGVHQIHFVWVLMRKRKRSGYLSRRTIRPYGGRVGRFCRATQRLPDFQHQFIGEVAAGDLLPTDDSVDEIRSEEHTSELQSLMRISYAVFCLKK